MAVQRIINFATLETELVSIALSINHTIILSDQAALAEGLLGATDDPSSHPMGMMGETYHQRFILIYYVKLCTQSQHWAHCLMICGQNNLITQIFITRTFDYKSDTFHIR